MSIAETYRAMSDDISRAARETNDEAVRSAYLALAELWDRAALRTSGFPSVVVNSPFPISRSV